MTPATSSLLDQLIGLQRLKTWSLLVTLFGDADGEGLDGKQVRARLAPLGIKPEAIRVALHRLKNDGWIDTQRSGREVLYTLSDRGRTDTQAAYRDVYRTDPKYPVAWRLFLMSDLGRSDAPPRSDAPRSDAHEADAVGPHSIDSKGIKVGRQILLLPPDAAPLDPALLEVKLTAAAVPDWFQTALVSSETLDLATRLAPLAERLVSASAPLPAVSESAIRLLLLHHWRKMALRTVCWVHIAHFPDGPIARTHAAVSTWLKGPEDAL